MAVELAEITADNLGEVYDLAVGPGQNEFVASNPWSLAQAYAERKIAWPRAIVADGTVVGVISSTTAPFCRDCDRARLTADGTLYRCLYAPSGIDLRTALRDGSDDVAIRDILRAAWALSLIHI